jgi:hypothetical protein
MNGFFKSKLKASLTAFAVVGVTGVALASPAEALQASQINPVYQSAYDETVSGLDTVPDSTSPATYAYYFETKKDHTKINALGLPIALNWAALSPSYTVNLYKVTWGTNTSNAVYTPLATTNFTSSLASSYISKDNYYWIPINPVDLGGASISDSNLTFAIGAVGDYSDTNGIGILTDGSGEFDPNFAWDGSGMNIASSALYGDFPLPIDYVGLDPYTTFGYFNANVSFEKVPGPLPLVGAGLAFGWSRRLKTRMRRATTAISFAN